MTQMIWVVWNPRTNETRRRGPQRTRPREHRTAVVVDHWPADDPPPADTSAAGPWDDWRRRRGASGVR